MQLKRTHLLTVLITGLALTASLTSVGHCAIITESGFNDTRATAQFISPTFFTPNVDPNVFGSLPTATILGSLDTDDGIDFYSFLGVGGSSTYFDIDDNPFTFDSIVSLFDSNGTLLAYDDDSGNDPGSASGLDTFLGVYNLPSTQTYFAAVTRFPNFANASGSGTQTMLTTPGGAFGGTALTGATFGDDTFSNPGVTGGGAYRLNISTGIIPNTAPVPEPGTMSLMALGLTSLIGAARRRKKKEEAGFERLSQELEELE